MNGDRCGSPALRGRDHCYYHHNLATRKPGTLTIPALEDGNAVNFVMQQLIEDIAADRIEPRKARLLLKALNAATNVLRYTTTQQDLILQRELKLITERHKAALSNSLALIDARHQARLTEIHTRATAKKKPAQRESAATPLSEKQNAVIPSVLRTRGTSTAPEPPQANQTPCHPEQSFAAGEASPRDNAFAFALEVDPAESRELRAENLVCEVQLPTPTEHCVPSTGTLSALIRVLPRSSLARLPWRLRVLAVKTSPTK